MARAPRAVETEPEETETDPDWASYIDKAPTSLQTRFADWILEKTEFDPNSVKSKDELFKKSIKLAVSLRIEFQKSPENREATAQQRVENAERAAARSTAVEATVEPPAPPAKKAAKKVAAAPAPTAATAKSPPRARPAKRSPAAAAEAAF